MLHSHVSPEILSAAHALASLRARPDRSVVLNEHRTGDLASLSRALRAAIADEQRVRGRAAVHVPPWITEPTSIRSWQDAAFNAARSPAGKRQLALHQDSYAECLTAAASSAATARGSSRTYAHSATSRGSISTGGATCSRRSREAAPRSSRATPPPGTHHRPMMVERTTTIPSGCPSKRRRATSG